MRYTNYIKRASFHLHWRKSSYNKTSEVQMAKSLEMEETSNRGSHCERSSSSWTGVLAEVPNNN